MIAAAVVDQEDTMCSFLDPNSFLHATNSDSEATHPRNQRIAQPHGQHGDLQPKKLCNSSQNIVSSEQIAQDQPHADVMNVSPILPFKDIKADKNTNFDVREENHFGQCSALNDISLAVDDLMIPWSELVLKEKIGAGICLHKSSYVLNVSAYHLANKAFEAIRSYSCLMHDTEYFLILLFKLNICAKY